MFTPSIRVALIALVTTASAVTACPGLSLNVTGPSAIDGVENLKVVATLTNTGDETLRLLNDPRSVLDTLPADSFTVTDSDGASPSFIGVRVKYSPSQAAKSTGPSALTVIEPGASVSFTHDLSTAYDFTDTGYNTYTIEPSNVFHIVDANNDVSEILATTDSYVTKLTSGALAVAAPALEERATFNGCSAAERSALNTTAPLAAAYARRAFSYLLTHNSPFPPSRRSATWFGLFNPSRHRVATDHFRRINANNFAGFRYDCTCKRSDVFAFVFANRFGTIFLCGQFWQAPLTGTDSKAGTLVHEASHFTVNGGTRDFAYGPTAARRLALTSPNQAVFNADNHEYFAENTPALP
ncbi:hypothetical protein V8D89_003221 [Ganoderma adspersum]